MIDIAKLKVKDFLAFQEASKCAEQTESMVKRMMTHEDDSLENQLLVQLLNPTEVRFAKENYLMGSHTLMHF